VLDGRCDGHREWQERNARARDVFRKRRREVTEAESSNEFVLDASRQRRSAVRGGRDVGTEKSAAELRCWMDAAMRTANGRKETQERVTYFGSDDMKSRKPRAVSSLSWTRRGRGRTALRLRLVEFGLSSPACAYRVCSGRVAAEDGPRYITQRICRARWSWLVPQAVPLFISPNAVWYPTRLAYGVRVKRSPSIMDTINSSLPFPEVSTCLRSGIFQKNSSVRDRFWILPVS